MWPIPKAAAGNSVKAKWIDSLDNLPAWMSFDNTTMQLTGTPVAKDDPDMESVSGYLWISFENPTTLPNQTHWVSIPLSVQGNQAPRPYNMTWNPQIGFVQQAFTPAVASQYWSMQLSTNNGTEVVDPDDKSFVLQADVKYDFNGTGFGGPSWVRFDFEKSLLEGTANPTDIGQVNYVTIKAKDYELAEARWKIRIPIVRDPTQSTTLLPTPQPTGSVQPTATATVQPSPTVPPSPSPTQTQGGGDPGSGPNVGAIVGGVFGALAAVGLIAGGLVYYNRSKKRPIEAEKTAGWDSHDEKGGAGVASVNNNGSTSPGANGGGNVVAAPENVPPPPSNEPPPPSNQTKVEMSQVSAVPSVKPPSATVPAVALAGAAGAAAIGGSLVRMTTPTAATVPQLPESPVLRSDSPSLSQSLGLDMPTGSTVVGVKTSPPAIRRMDTPPRPAVTALDVSAIPLNTITAPAPTAAVAATTVAATATAAASTLPAEKSVKIEPIFAVPSVPASASAAPISPTLGTSQLPPVAVIIPPQIVKQQSKENLVQALTYITPEGLHETADGRPPSSASSHGINLQKKTSNISLAGSTVSSNPSLHKKASSSSLTRVVPPQMMPSPSEQAVIASKVTSPTTEEDATAAKEAALRELQAKEAQAETQKLLAEAQQQIALQHQQELAQAAAAGATATVAATELAAPTTPTSPTGERPASYTGTRPPQPAAAAPANRKSEPLATLPKLAPLTLPFAAPAGGAAAASAAKAEPTPGSTSDDDSDDSALAQASEAVKAATSVSGRPLTEAELAQLSQVKAMLSGARSQFYEPGDMVRSRSPTAQTSTMPPSPNPNRQGGALFDVSRSNSRDNLAGSATPNLSNKPTSGMTTPTTSMPPSPSLRSVFMEGGMPDPAVSAASGKYSVVDGLPCAELVAKVGKPFFYLPLTIQPAAPSASGTTTPGAANPPTVPTGLITYSLKPHAPATSSPRWLKIHYRTGGVSGLPYNNDKGEFTVDVVRTDKETGNQEVMEVIKIAVQEPEVEGATEA